MAKKYYAVKTGHKPGIYVTWDECKKQVDGFSGATYKSFPTLAEAEAFLGLTEIEKHKAETMSGTISEAVAYVDGSYEDSVKEFSYGLIMFADGIEEHFAEKFNTPNLVSMRNVAGEIIGAQKAMQYCIDNDIKSLDLYYDYEGIEKWCTGVWKANKEGTKAYKQFYDSIKSDLRVTFYKVAAHTGDTYNELADQLAKAAIRGEEYAPIKKEDNMAKDNSVYIDRTDVDALVLRIGKEEWGEKFNVDPIYQKGNPIQFRCDFSIDDVSESVDFFFRGDGKTTLNVVGNSTQFAPKLIEMIKVTAYSCENLNTNCTFSNVTNGTYLKLIDYLLSIEKISKDEDREIPTPSHRHIKFSSAFGDTMVINRYNTGKLLFQGSPAYILTEALSFMSMATEISLDEIIERKNEAYKSDITVDKTRAELRQRLPNTYDKLDEVILKLLSPSIALSVADISVEDYGCYVFPAFKALEALLLDLLAKNNIFISTKQNFSIAFNRDSDTDLFYLHSKHVQAIDNPVVVDVIERIYNYFNSNRHVEFHANQVLSATSIINDKLTADTKLNEVLILFEEVGIKILK